MLGLWSKKLLTVNKEIWTQKSKKKRTEVRLLINYQQGSTYIWSQILTQVSLHAS